LTISYERGLPRHDSKSRPVDEERHVRLEAAASLFKAAAEELELAGAHARRSAEHIRAGDMPRGTAHAWAALGHLRTGEDRLMVQAREHRKRSSV
jgi:hypothetical protein